MQCHQLDHMQTICTSLHTDNHTKASSLKIALLDAEPNQQCQSTEGRIRTDNNDVLLLLAVDLRAEFGCHDRKLSNDRMINVTHAIHIKNARIPAVHVITLYIYLLIY